jgi:hypothetical protein
MLLLEQVIRENPFATKYFAWCDASISRFNNYRRNWNFSIINPHLTKVQHYDNMMYFHGRKMTINASLIRGNGNILLQMINEFRGKLEFCADDRYPHDEETLLEQVKLQNDRYFMCLG